MKSCRNPKGSLNNVSLMGHLIKNWKLTCHNILFRHSGEWIENLKLGRNCDWKHCQTSPLLSLIPTYSLESQLCLHSCIASLHIYQIAAYLWHVAQLCGSMWLIWAEQEQDIGRRYQGCRSLCALKNNDGLSFEEDNSKPLLYDCSGSVWKDP